MTAGAAKRIFRKSALDRLSTPEQLDRMIPVVATRDWIGALVMIGLLACAATWAFLGSVPTRVKGSGILIATGGRVVDAVASGEGALIAIVAPVGARVNAGETIARVEQRDLRQTLDNMIAVVKEREAQHESALTQMKESFQALSASIAARRRLLDVRARDADEQVAALTEELPRQEAMFERRLITLQKLNDTRQSLTGARQMALEARSQTNLAESEEITARNANEREVRTSLERIAEARRRQTELEVQIKQREEISSPVTGRVTEWKAAVGARVAPGQPLVAVESGVTGLELVLYVPPDQGKRVRPGMVVRVAPSTVRREEYGTLVGEVIDVSDFPATPQAMLATMQNDRLVQQLSPKGAPFAARVRLSVDKATPSGFVWSSGIGPNTQLSSGTLADGEVTVEARAPITFVLPLLRRFAGFTD